MPTALEELQSRIDGQQTRTFVYLGEEEDVSSITQALRGSLGDDLNRSGVCSISFYGEDYAGWDTNEVPDLFQVIGDQQVGITKLALEGFVPEFPSTETVFPLRVLTNLLRRMRHRLEGLYLNDVVLNGTLEDIQEFVQVVSELVCLRCCRLRETMTILQDMATPRPLDEVLGAITILPLLLEMAVETRWWEPDDSVRRYVLPFQHHHQHPVHGICTSSSLQSLHFHFLHPNNTAFPAICRSLQTNTTLKTLSLQFANYYDNYDHSTHFHFVPFCHFLQSKTALKELEVEFKDSPNLDLVVISIASAISNNSHSCLKLLKLTARCCFGTTVEDALVRLMRSNYLLQCLDISTMDDEGHAISFDPRNCTELELYIRLNCCGRKALMSEDESRDGTATRKQFVQAFAKLSNDLDALYYYLQMNPWLCQKEAPAIVPPPSRAAKKRRPIPADRLTVLPSEQSAPQSSFVIPKNINMEEDLSAAYANALLEIERLKKENADLKARLPANKS